MGKNESCLGILSSTDDSWKNYVNACEELGCKYEVVDFLRHDAIEHIAALPHVSGFLARPPGKIRAVHDVYIKRLNIIVKELGKKVYPSLGEMALYEDKTYLSEWLSTKPYPHIPFYLVTSESDAHMVLDRLKFPIVMKGSIGSSGSSVTVVRKRSEANRNVRHIFSPIHPNLKIRLRKHTRLPRIRDVSNQKHYAILQEFKEIKWEWRIIKIDDSYFGRRKLLKGDFASGSKSKGWGPTPVVLLELTDKICTENGFCSMAVDILETLDGEYFVNELQTFFGVTPSDFGGAQCIVEDQPGRYVKNNGCFVFEPGDFMSHMGYMLRVKHFLKLLNQSGI